MSTIGYEKLCCLADLWEKNMTINRKHGGNFTVKFDIGTVQDGDYNHLSIYGEGDTAEKAVDDYWNKIKGYRIVFWLNECDQQVYEIPFE